jgi:peptidoglycan/LPS O-acetylase OafA/YrhL
MGMAEKSGIHYIPALDGLRALAIIAIIFFHYWPAGTGLLTGGFVGVDIFFVVSGYLITLLLFDEWQKNGKIDLKKFWLRRARRLLPAVIFLVAVIVLGASILPIVKDKLEMMNPIAANYVPDLSDELANMRMQVVSALLYFSNWYLIFRGTSYFDITARPSPFEHLWSLAIEEQFYLFWPIILVGLIFLLKKDKRFIAMSIFLLAILSAILMVIQGKASPMDARAYFGTDTRAYALMLGAALAVLWKPEKEVEMSSRLKAPAIDLFGIIGLAIMGYLCWTLIGGEINNFQGGLLMVSIATVLVITAGVRKNSFIVRPFLSNGILRWIGKRSYGIYLWHWPVFIATESAYTYPLDGWQLLLLRFTTLLVIVELSYRLVECPIRNGIVESHLHKIKVTEGKHRQKAIMQFVSAAVIVFGMIIFCSSSIVSAKPGMTSSVHFDKTKMTNKQNLVAADENTEKEDETSDEVVGEPESVTINLKSEEKVGSDGQNVTTKEKQNNMVGVQGGKPAKIVSVLAVGDSVMLGARQALEDLIPGIQVNAVVSRQFDEVARIIARLKTETKLPPIVVVHTGDNGDIEEDRFIEMMENLKDCKRVVIFNVRVPRIWKKRNNQIIAEFVPDYPNVVFVDWDNQSSERRSEIFGKDGIHIKNIRAARFYANLVKQAIGEISDDKDLKEKSISK